MIDLTLLWGLFLVALLTLYLGQIQSAIDSAGPCLMNETSWPWHKWFFFISSPLSAPSVDVIRHVKATWQSTIRGLQVSSHAVTLSPPAAHVVFLRLNLYANNRASCPLSAGARVGFPHSWRLTPPLFDSGLPSGPRGYHSQSVASFVFIWWGVFTKDLWWKGVLQ